MPLSASYLRPDAYIKKGRKITPSRVFKDSWTNPITLDADGYSVSHAGAGSASTRNMTLGGALTTGGVGIADFARNVVITVTHASAVVAMSGVITGTDIFGNTITEAWSVTAGTTSKTFTGKKGFKTVTSISETVAADASANSIVAGTGVVFGLSAPLAVASALKETSAGSVVTNGVFVAASVAATDDAQGTYAPNSAPNGSTSYVVWYLSDS